MIIYYQTKFVKTGRAVQEILSGPTQTDRQHDGRKDGQTHTHTQKKPRRFLPNFVECLFRCMTHPVYTGTVYFIYVEHSGYFQCGIHTQVIIKKSATSQFWVQCLKTQQQQKPNRPVLKISTECLLHF